MTYPGHPLHMFVPYHPNNMRLAYPPFQLLVPHHLKSHQTLIVHKLPLAQSLIIVWAPSELAWPMLRFLYDFLYLIHPRSHQTTIWVSILLRRSCYWMAWQHAWTMLRVFNKENPNSNMNNVGVFIWPFCCWSSQKVTRPSSECQTCRGAVSTPGLKIFSTCFRNCLAVLQQILGVPQPNNVRLSYS